jgi:formate dehydrogenase subunit gamma
MGNPMPEPSDDSHLSDRVRRILADHRDVEGACLPVLQAVQREFGYVPGAALPMIAAALRLSQADVHGVLSFYRDLRREPPARHVVQICQGEACQAMGARELTAELERQLGAVLGGGATEGGVALEPAYCFGNCGLGAAATVDGRLYGRATARLVMDKLGDGG